LQGMLKGIHDDPDTPPEVKKLIEQTTSKGNPLFLLLGIIAGGMFLINMIQGVSEPLKNASTQKQERIFKTFRMDPMSIITAWRRDPEKYAWLFDDLKDQGWTEERISAVKFLTEFMPSPQDLVNWQAKEVFEPKMIERYGLDDEFEGLDLSLFAKVGVSEEHAKNYWRAHWEHASWMQVVEMLHRGQLTEAEVWEWFRLVEIPPFWRDKLIAISWNVPTRVDVRRWWDLRTIDEPRLREIYTAQGYHDKDLEDYVLWTKVYTAWPDLVARWKNGWISEGDLRAELVAMGMPGARVDELIQTKIKAASGERTAGEKDLTKTDIIKGVKTGRVTRAQGIELLEDLGYSEDEADFILFINIPPDEEEVQVAARELTKADIQAGLKTKQINESEARSRLIALRYLPADADILMGIFKARIKP
ncbi:hypothetical protein LCGC14_2764130, partial [marine sediment metagenome]